jgi:hypothetical protein
LIQSALTATISTTYSWGFGPETRGAPWGPSTESMNRINSLFTVVSADFGIMPLKPCSTITGIALKNEAFEIRLGVWVRGVPHPLRGLSKCEPSPARPLIGVLRLQALRIENRTTPRTRQWDGIQRYPEGSNVPVIAEEITCSHETHLLYSRCSYRSVSNLFGHVVVVKLTLIRCFAKS